jgi:hypothetical protein
MKRRELEGVKRRAVKGACFSLVDPTPVKDPVYVEKGSEEGERVKGSERGERVNRRRERG